MYAALETFGAPMQSLHVEDLATEGIVFQIGVAPNRIDVLTAIDGVAFVDAWSTRITSQYGSATVFVIGRAELIKNKLATGRSQDRLDVEQLSRSRG